MPSTRRAPQPSRSVCPRALPPGGGGPGAPSGCCGPEPGGRVAHPCPQSFLSFPKSERGCPILAFFARVGRDAADSIILVMPRGLHRYYGADHLHFITCSCYRRMSLLRSARSRDRLLSVLEQTRQRYRFVVVGYVVMPEHIHLLLSEPVVGPLPR